MAVRKHKEEQYFVDAANVMAVRKHKEGQYFVDAAFWQKV